MMESWFLYMDKTLTQTKIVSHCQTHQRDCSECKQSGMDESHTNAL